MSLRLVSDWRACHDEAVALLRADGPAFLSRIGGSDTFVIAEYLRVTTEGSGDFSDVFKWRALVERYNGFYERAPTEAGLLAYCETMLEAYLACRRLIFCNHQLLAMYFPGNIHPSFLEKPIEKRESLEGLIAAVETGAAAAGAEIPCYPYPFVEKMTRDPWTLFRAFAQALPGQRVLVVSPFARSIRLNFDNRKGFFRDYDYRISPWRPATRR